MWLSRITINNYRNFKSLDVKLGQHAVVLGENKVGKTNLLCALRLILDPTLPNAARRLRIDDFWDGLARPLTKDDAIEISVEFRGFENNENLLAVLSDHLVKPDPMVSRITYRYQPIAGLKGAPKGEADYEFVIFGGDRPDNTVGYDLRRWMPLDLFPALRDAEADLARWSRSPLRPLLDRAAKTIDGASRNHLGPLLSRESRSQSEILSRIQHRPSRRKSRRGKRASSARVAVHSGFNPICPEYRLADRGALFVALVKRGF